MSNLLKDFLAARAGKPPKQAATNEAQPVTRAEFGTLVKVVEALVEDVQAATSPENLAKVFNAALKDLPPAQKPDAFASLSGKYLLPSDDNEEEPATATIANKLGYKLPKGD